MSKEKMNIEVSGVEVTIKGQKIKLTEIETRQLASALNALLGSGNIYYWPGYINGSITATSGSSGSPPDGFNWGSVSNAVSGA